MTTLGNYYHDFPRLAKQSGYFFQLFRGRVNWLDIENLNIDEIIENKDFQLLEQNLLNVVNCDLEKEYDLKILDQKFVKLFKLAQLGVDYLSYCEMYLDRCVILLQDQLIQVQEDYELLKKENEKKNEELKKIKKKSKTQNYQCTKCEKVFISEVYLKYHDKRRHSSQTTPKILNTPDKKCVDACQQTEDEKKFTVSTQSLNTEKEEKENEEMSKAKEEKIIKIEHLEKELEELKIRLKTAEDTLMKKTEASSSNVSSCINVPNPVYYSGMLPVFPPYFPHPWDGYYEANPSYQPPVLEYHQPVCPTLRETVDTECVKDKPAVQNSRSEKSEEKEVKDEILNETATEAPTVMRRKKFQDKQKQKIQKFDCDKENIDPENKNTVKPVPFPRQTIKMFRPHFTTKEQTMVQTFTEPETNNHPESDIIAFCNESVTSCSTPIEENPETDNNIDKSKENLSKVNEKKILSNESLISNETIPTESKPSFIKKIVSRNSPNLQGFGKNFKKSLTNLYDSVSSSGKDLRKTKECERQDAQSIAIDGLNSQLRKLGVDPDWSGIPKKTMKQKLKDLKHRRKSLAKDHPTYLAIRQSIEKNIFQKLGTNLLNLGTKKGVSEEETNAQEPIEPESYSPTQDSSPEKRKVRNVTFKEEPVGDSSDSETKISDLEEPEKLNTRQGVFPQKAAFESSSTDLFEGKSIDFDKEFDLSVFQVDRMSLKDLVNERRKKKEVELQKDSDSDDDFLEDFSIKSFETNTDFFCSKAKTNT